MSDTFVSSEQPPVPKRVMFLYSSNTGGHAAAAAAVAEQLKEFPGVEVQSLNLKSADTGKANSGSLRRWITHNLPSLRKLWFELAFQGNPLAYALGGWSMDRQAKGSPRALQSIKDGNPDLIVATHSIANRMVAYWKSVGELDVPLHCIPTDFRTHRLWAQKAVEHYYVAPGGCKEDLQHFGIAPEKISETGIPVRSTTPGRLGHAQLKQRLGLDPDLPVVSIMGGSLGLQPFKMLVEALHKVPGKFQVVCITAKNAVAKAELEALSPGIHPLHIQGTVKNMPEWLTASDVVLTKPGGLTCAEVLAQGKPIVFAELYSGLETPLIERMVKMGVAAAGRTAAETAELIAGLVTNPERCLAMQKRAQAMARPDAAFNIAQELALRVRLA